MLRNFTTAGVNTMTKFVIMLIWSIVGGLHKEISHKTCVCPRT